MEALGILASLIAVCQASDRLVGLFCNLQRFKNAHEEIELLRACIENLELVLVTARDEHCAAETGKCPKCALLNYCDKAVSMLRDLVEECTIKSQTLRGAGHNHLVKLRWLKRRARIEVLRDQVRDAVTLLTMHASLSNSTGFITNFNCAIQGSHPSLFLVSGPTKTTIPEASSKLPQKHRSVGSSTTLSETGRHIQIVEESFVSPATKRIDIVARSRLGPSICQWSHKPPSRWLFKPLEGIFGTLFVLAAGDSAVTTRCCEISCRENRHRRFCVLYLGPGGISSLLILLSLTWSPRLQFSLSVLRIQRPDATFVRCIRQGDLDGTKQHLANGSGHAMDIVFPYGLPVLQFAIMYGQKAVCDLLLEQGAGQLPAYSTWARQDIFNYFIRTTRADSSLSSGAVVGDYVTCMRSAAAMSLSNDRYLKLELDSFSRFHRALLRLSSEKLVDLCRSCRHDLNSGDIFGRTPLHWAARIADVDALRQLLCSGADMEVTDWNGVRPIHVAAAAGDLECLQLLINSGADIEAKAAMGQSPLKFACVAGHLEAMQCLLDAGADIESMSDFGENVAICANHAQNGFAVRYLIDCGVDIDHLDDWGYTPVSDAILTDSHDALKVHIATKPLFNTVLLDGKTVLHIAASNSDLRTLELLLTADLGSIDPYAVDCSGRTALDYLKQREDACDLAETFGALLLKVEQFNKERPVYEFRNDDTVGEIDEKELLESIYFDTVETPFQNVPGILDVVA